MERRRAVAIAAATAATTLGAVAAIAANFGLLGFGTPDGDPVGKLIAGRTAEVVGPAATDPTTPIAGPNVTVRYEDIYLPAPASPAGAATPVATPAATVTSNYEAGDDHGEGHDEDEGRENEEHEEEDD